MLETAWPELPARQDGQAVLLVGQPPSAERGVGVRSRRRPYTSAGGPGPRSVARRAVCGQGNRRPAWRLLCTATWALSLVAGMPKGRASGRAIGGHAAPTKGHQFVDRQKRILQEKPSHPCRRESPPRSTPGSAGHRGLHRRLKLESTTPAHFSRPSGTPISRSQPFPSDESLGYCQPSLRD